MPSIGSNSGIVPAPQLRAVPSRPSLLTVPPETPLAASAVTPARPALLNAGTAPVDGERVALIKKAIESDNYPLVPAKISDAIIAAGLLLRAKK